MILTEKLWTTYSFANILGAWQMRNIVTEETRTTAKFASLFWAADWKYIALLLTCNNCQLSGVRQERKPPPVRHPTSQSHISDLINDLCWLQKWAQHEIQLGLLHQWLTFNLISGKMEKSVPCREDWKFFYHDLN